MRQVTIMHGPTAFQVKADGTAYQINPVEEAVRDIAYARAQAGVWVMGRHRLLVEPGLSGAIEAAWQQLQD